MRTRLLSAAAVVVSGALLAMSTCAARAQAPDPPDPVKRLEEQIRSLTEEVKALKADRERERAAQEKKAQEQPPDQAADATKLAILADEVARLRQMLVLPELAEYKSLYGLGPAASKVYGLQRGLAIGGYGEAFLTLFPGSESPQNFADFLRFVLYVGYKFSDRLIFNSEIEFEHAFIGGTTVSRGSGSIALEFAYLDFRIVEQASIRGGLVLIPMGWLNELHEPPTYFGVFRPRTEQVIIPTTWRSLGGGVYGELFPGLVYRTYVVTSFNAAGFTDLAAYRGGRQQGNRELAEDWAWTGRIDWTGVPGLIVGGSWWWGNTAQGMEFAGQDISANLVMYDLHAQFQWRGLWLRGLFAQGFLQDAGVLSQAVNPIVAPIASMVYGAYGEIAYDVLPLIFPGTQQSLWPFFRYEWTNTQARVPAGLQPDEAGNVQVLNTGVSYKPVPNVVIKGDYRRLAPKSGDPTNEINLGFGFNF